MRARRATPHDLARLVRQAVDRAIDEWLTSRPITTLHGKNPHAVAMGKMGGLKGGQARTKALSPFTRTAIARKAALARWGRRTKV